MPSPSAGKTPRAVSPKFRNSPIPASSAPERSPEKIAAASPPRSRKPSMIPCKAIPIAAPMPENRPDTTSAAPPNAEASRSAAPETAAPTKPIAEETAGPTAPAMADPAPVAKFTALSKADATAPTAARTPDATASQTPRRNALTASQLSMTTTASVTAAPMARRQGLAEKAAVSSVHASLRLANPMIAAPTAPRRVMKAAIPLPIPATRSASSVPSRPASCPPHETSRPSAAPMTGAAAEASATTSSSTRRMSSKCATNASPSASMPLRAVPSSESATVFASRSHRPASRAMPSRKPLLSSAACAASVPAVA